MDTHATAGKQWTETELDSLTVACQFRLRGLEVTRLDTFIDAECRALFKDWNYNMRDIDHESSTKDMIVTAQP